MEISFSDKEACELFCRRAQMEHVFGPALARLVCCRLAVLRSSRVLSLLRREPPIMFTAVDGSGCLAVALGKAHRLEFRAAASQAAQDASTVTSITIIGVKAAPILRERTP